MSYVDFEDAALEREAAAFTRAISPTRLDAFAAASGGDLIEARRLYLWDRDLAVALLADIAVLEVALRTAIASSLAERWGPSWFSNPNLVLDDRSLRQLAQAWRSIPDERRRPESDGELAGRLIARCTFGFWTNLLGAGGYAGLPPRRLHADYEELWRSTLRHAFPGARVEASRFAAQPTRRWTHGHVSAVGALRNRIAHHEPLHAGIRLPGQAAVQTPAESFDSCRRLARLLDRDLAAWLDRSSRVPAVLAARPSEHDATPLEGCRS